MINVGFLYDTVSDLLVKNQSGHMGNDAFNRGLELTQHHVLDFLTPNSENQRVHEALKPFIKSVSGVGNIAIPADLHYKLSVKAHYFANGFTEHNSYMMATDEDNLTMSSPTRGPNKDKGIFLYRMDSNGITNYPLDVPFTVGYIRKPAVAFRAVTADTVNDVENYNSGGSTHLEWPDSEIGKFIDVLLYVFGVQVQKSEIVQYIDAKKVIA